MEATGRELTILTEKDVQKVALSALRSYYRFRVKAGAPELISDVRGAGGIIADVQYSFPQEDGSRFMATLEATSFASKNEVYFRRSWGLLLVDSVAISSFATAILYTISSVRGLGLLIHYSIPLVFLILLAVFISLGSILSLILMNTRRYRYIYAVEQFKQYHADEQWIAVGEDVFPDHQNHYFQELREQCIKYGFGLIQVDRTRKPFVLITPARREIFQHNRRRVILFSPQQLERMRRGGTFFREQFVKVMSGLPMPAGLTQLQKLPNSLKGINKLPAPFNPSDPAYLFRFKRSYQNQLVLLGFAWVLLLTVGWQEFSKRPIRYIGQQRYAQEVLAETEARGPEPIFIMDPYDTIYLRPFDSTVVPYLALLRSEGMIADGFMPRVGNEVLIGMFEDALILYDCERLYNFETSKYLVQEGVYPDFESASQRMSQLILHKMEINCLWMGCFGTNKNQYVLYFGLLQNKLSDAQNLAKQYQKKLAALQLNTKVSIRMLSKPKR